MSGELQALRYNSGKIRLSLVPPSLVRYVGAVLTYGAEKYDAHNWRKGFNWSSIMDSLERHYVAIKSGEDFDEESGLPHIAHLDCNAAFLTEHFDQMLGVDDRYRLKPGRVLQWNRPPAPPTGA
jgi:hypothetical protein